MRLEDVSVGMKVRVLPDAKDITTTTTSFNHDGLMDKYLGKKFTVRKIERENVRFEEIEWHWAPEWLEPVEEEGTATGITYHPSSIVGPEGPPATDWYSSATLKLYGAGKKEEVKMIDDEKKFVDAGVEIDEERLREDREELVEDLRDEFWSLRVGKQILFATHQGTTEGTLEAVSPSHDRMKVSYLGIDQDGDYMPRTEWLNTSTLLEILGPTTPTEE